MSIYKKKINKAGLMCLLLINQGMAVRLPNVIQFVLGSALLQSSGVVAPNACPLLNVVENSGEPVLQYWPDLAGFINASDNDSYKECEESCPQVLPTDRIVSNETVFTMLKQVCSSLLISSTVESYSLFCLNETSAANLTHLIWSRI